MGNIHLARDRETLSAEIQAALDTLAGQDRDGLVQPEAVVEAAKNPESPLHRYFEWDTDRAAYNYWLVQARHLIAQYSFVRINNEPKYVNVTLANGRRGYVSTERAVADPDLYEQIVSDAERVIGALRNKLSAFERAKGVVATLGEAIEQMKATTKKPRTGRKAA